MRFNILMVLALSTSTLVACGGAQPPATPPPSMEVDAGGAEPTAEAGAPTENAAGPHAAATEEAAFDDLPKEKKVEVMQSKVVPSIGRLLKEHDGKKFEKFGCASCHGPQKKDDPRDVLPKLTLSNGGFEKLSKQKPEMMKLMSEKVVPAMAAALGEKPFDPTTKQGFGCAGCHKVD